MGAWTKAEEKTLLEFYPDNGPNWGGWEVILPGRSQNAIAVRAASLGVKVSHEARQRIAKANASKRPGCTHDPMEEEVMLAMENGVTPSEIDAWYHWVPGTAKRVLMARWERIGV